MFTSRCQRRRAKNSTPWEQQPLCKSDSQSYSQWLYSFDVMNTTNNSIHEWRYESHINGQFLSFG